MAGTVTGRDILAIGTVAGYKLAVPDALGIIAIPD